MVQPTQAPQPSPAAKPAPATQPAPATPQQQFEGKPVKKLRDAKAGDPNWMEGTDQVIIALDDGTERTVRRNELTEAPK
jgi:hypothetical protein